MSLLKNEPKPPIFNSKPKKYLLIPIFITICLDFISMGVIIPVIGPLLLSSNQILSEAISFSDRAIILGLFVGAFPLAAFFGAPFMGALSDKFGRKTVLSWSLIVNFFAYLILAVGVGSSNLFLMFLARMVSGFAGAVTNTGVAAMVDITDPRDRVKNFGLIGVFSFACGFILGPFIASFYTNRAIMPWFNPATPFYFVAVWCLMNLGIIHLFLEETVKVRSANLVSPISGIVNIYKAAKLAHFRNVFLIVFLVTFAFNFFAGFFQTFLTQKFGYGTSESANIFAILGVSMALTQGLIVRFIPKKYKPENILLVCLPFLSLVLVALIFPTDPFAYYILLPFLSVFQGIAWPYSSAVISNLASDDSQGEMLGINASLQALAQTLPPILAGFIAVVHLNLPLILASVSALLAWVLVFSLLHLQKHSS